MVSFPNCKINLGLRVLQKRNDGYHDIETVFFPLPFSDVLELVPSAADLSFTMTGEPVEGSKGDNLCLKAYELLKKDFPSIPSLQIHLHKNIPVGAGLGGGSADAAFMLLMLNKRFNLGISTDGLISYALQIGSDCPFFIINTPCYATSRGEKLSPAELDLSSYSFVIVNPGIHIHTGKAFSYLQPAIPAKPLTEIISQPVSVWKNELLNDFEKPVFEQHPAIAAIKEELYAKKALYASMSGSGSTVYGIYERNKIPEFSFPGEYYIKIQK